MSEQRWASMLLALAGMWPITALALPITPDGLAGPSSRFNAALLRGFLKARRRTSSSAGSPGDAAPPACSLDRHLPAGRQGRFFFWC